MLKYFQEEGLVKVFDQQPKDWEEAIRMSGEIMIERGLINNQYVEEVIHDVKEFGPYIVIVPHVAMPHSQATSEGVLGTGVGLSIMPGPVSFEEGNEEKDAELFFMLAAKNTDEHLKNITNLTDLLMTDGVIEDLLTVKNMEDYLQVMKKYQ
ncbi:PTS sugar transporter subunit IIA [Atopobacter phocae]|uniref:PTS sugar transporter subunit IIA n=1 Tax=Atopobacter phocae TaxID=136492 RepID=UPI00046F2B92|nr:PTS sugar transporter subunit IIA [Atopobacter phocae]